MNIRIYESATSFEVTDFQINEKKQSYTIVC